MPGLDLGWYPVDHVLGCLDVDWGLNSNLRIWVLGSGGVFVGCWCLGFCVLVEG